MAFLKNVSYIENFYRHEGFKAANMDIAGGGAGPNYYGFISLNGDYYILKETIAGTVTTYEYYQPPLASAQDNLYATDWTGRAGLTYARYDVAFTRVG